MITSPTAAILLSGDTSRISQLQPGSDVGVAWSPRIIESIWGYYQIIVGGVDVTYYRNVVTKPARLTWAEPFGPATAELVFAQITPFDYLPGFLQWGSMVEVWHVDENYNRVGADPMWDGIVVATSSRSGQDFALTVQCVGALFQADLYRKKPDIGRAPPGGWIDTDIGTAISDEINQRTRYGTMRLHFFFPVTTGIITRSRGGWDSLLSGWVQDVLATATTDDGNNQWTVDCVGRRPILKLKDTTTIHWTIMNATPGVEVSLEADVTQTRNVFYGEGIDNENCRWRNQKFPYLRTGKGPVFPGRLITLGVSGADVQTWKDEMGRSGYSMSPGSTYTSNDRNHCRGLQTRAGIQVDGVVGPQTWAATFESASLGDDDVQAIILPMVWSIQAEPRLYNAQGEEIGYQEHFNPAVLRVEEYQNLGDRISFNEGIRSFSEQWNRDVYTKLQGTIVLHVDPEQGSRWDIRAGQNIMVKMVHGRDTRLHIAGVEADLEEGTVTLTVDEKNRDLMTVAAVISRRRETTDPVRREPTYFRSSRVVEDRLATWDCENGSGIIPRMAQYNKLWNVVRIPMSEGGNIVRSRFQLDIASRFSVAVFDRHITANQLASYGMPLDEGYYDKATSGFDSDALGCLIAWGQHEDAAGFYPKREGDDPVPGLSGVLQDDGSWQFHTTKPPWVWVAMWVESPKVNYISGRFYLSVMDN